MNKNEIKSLSIFTEFWNDTFTLIMVNTYSLADNKPITTAEVNHWSHQVVDKFLTSFFFLFFFLNFLTKF